MVSGVVLVQFPEINPVAIYGIAAMLGIAGYQVVEIFIQRRLSKENKTDKGGK